jgi:hypothetical protein
MPPDLAWGVIVVNKLLARRFQNTAISRRFSATPAAWLIQRHARASSLKYVGLAGHVVIVAK